MPFADTLLPLFLLIGLGFAAIRLGWLPAQGVAPMGALVVRLALPALIFLALAGSPPAETLSPGLLLAYAAGSLAAMAACWTLARLALGLPRPAAAVVALGAAMANSGFMGLPIAQALTGAETAGRLLAHCMMVENLVVLPLALWLMGPAPGGGGGALQGILRNPLMWALLAGLGTGLAGIGLPPALTGALELLARLAAPLALVVIGGMLATLPVQGRAGSVALLVAGKLALHPLAVWAALQLAPGTDPALAAGAILFAAMPMVTIFPLLGARAGQGQLAAMGLTAATLGSFLTLPAAIALLGLGTG